MIATGECHSRSLKVIKSLVSFDRTLAIFCYFSTATVTIYLSCLSCTVLDILAHISQDVKRSRDRILT